MDCWQQVKQQLQQLLQQQWEHHHVVDEDERIIQYQFDLIIPPICGGILSWLKGQSHYPRFFWQAREDETQCVALGQVKRFAQLSEAQRFLRQHQTQPLQLVGGLTFEGKAHFYLPRIWLQQNAETLTVTLNLSTDDSASAVNAFLAELNPAVELSAVTAQLNLESQNYSQTSWSDLVEESLSSIEQGRFTKVVLAQKKSYDLSAPVNPHDLLAHARAQHPSCYYFLWAESAEQAFLGASPERLYKRHQQQLCTEALAGTAECGQSQQQNQQQQQWLLQDSKNIHENWLVVEDICAKLANLSLHLDIHELSSKKLSYVQHLIRQIGAKLHPEVDDQACLTAIHPSAAVGGLPYASALKFIAERQNFRRDWYAGTLGVMSLLKSEFCVTIRSTLLNQDKIAIFTGAGIVAGSVPLLEWQEIERKAAGILSLFPV